MKTTSVPPEHTTGYWECHGWRSNGRGFRGYQPCPDCREMTYEEYFAAELNAFEEDVKDRFQEFVERTKPRGGVE